MKKYILYPLISFVILFLLYGCSDNDRYETSVVRQYELYLNGEPWSLRPGIATKPFFIYNTQHGDFVANYTSHYRFTLENGSYKFVLTSDPENIIPNSIIATNLNDLVINQFEKADKSIEISAAVEYKSPFSEVLKLNMISRTGTLRLRATDLKSDRSYSTVRAVVTSNRSGYRVLDETYIESPIDIIRSKATSTGGVNYTDDFIILNTENAQKGVEVRFELLDKNGEIVLTRKLGGLFEIWGNTMTLVEFQLNDTDNPIIQDYNVTILDEDWADEEYNPAPPFYVPDGYKYVSPTENLQTIYNEMLNDPLVDEIKLYLKAGATYNIGRPTITKNVSILGQTPDNGDAKAAVNFGNVGKIEGDISYIHFENLDILPNDAYIFNLDATALFDVDEIAFKNCNIDNLKRNLWRQQASIAGIQVVDNFILDDVRMLNLASEQNYSTISMTNGNPILNITINNTTMHVLGTGFRKTFIEGTRGQTESLSVTVKNSTFIRLGNADMTIFDLRADGGSSSIDVTIKNNLFSGISESGKGRWMYLSGNAVKDISDNYYTSDFVMNNWGVDTGELPTATVSKDDLFQDASTGNLTIKDKTSIIYTNRVGDPRWLE